MPRPIKWRKVCCLPSNNKFGPIDSPNNTDNYIIMTVDEYETIRLIDLEGLNQKQCALNMDIARSTVQNIYSEARTKLADSLINGKTLIIRGGEYKLCKGLGNGCHKCRKRDIKL